MLTHCTKDLNVTCHNPIMIRTPVTDQQTNNFALSITVLPFDLLELKSGHFRKGIINFHQS